MWTLPQTRGGTCAPCIGRQIPSHWATREALFTYLICSRVYVNPKLLSHPSLSLSLCNYKLAFYVCEDSLYFDITQTFGNNCKLTDQLQIQDYVSPLPIDSPSTLEYANECV